MCELCKKLGKKLLTLRELCDMHNDALKFYAEGLIDREELTDVVNGVDKMMKRGEWCRGW